MDFECRFAQLFEYWQSIKGPLVAPKRENFDPCAVFDQLPKFILLERRDDGVFVIRLAGFDIEARLGSSLVGKNFFDVFPPCISAFANSLASKDLSCLLDWPMGLVGARRWYAHSGPFRCFFIFLPLLDSRLRPYKLIAQFDFEPRNLLEGSSRLERFGRMLTLRSIDLGAGIDERYQMLPLSLIGRTVA